MTLNVDTERWHDEVERMSMTPLYGALRVTVARMGGRGGIARNGPRSLRSPSRALGQCMNLEVADGR